MTPSRIFWNSWSNISTDSMGPISGVGMAILSPLEVQKVLTWPLSRQPPPPLSFVEERAVGIPQRSREKARIIACAKVCHWRGVCSCLSSRQLLGWDHRGFKGAAQRLRTLESRDRGGGNSTVHRTERCPCHPSPSCDAAPFPLFSRARPSSASVSQIILPLHPRGGARDTLIRPAPYG
jgi:hypothetical protein